MFDQLFGGKSWYKSMTGWAALLLTVAWTLVPGLAEVGALSPEVTTTITDWMTKLSVPLGMLGIRRKLPA